MNPNGLYLVEEFLTPNEEKSLIKGIKTINWENTKNPKQRQFNRNKQDEPIPPWLDQNTNSLQGLLNSLADQIIIKEYPPGLGTCPQIASTENYGPKIIIASLGAPAILVLRNNQEKHEYELHSRSTFILSGEARFCWTYAIRPKPLQHGTRYSITITQSNQVRVLSIASKKPCRTQRSPSKLPPTPTSRWIPILLPPTKDWGSNTVS